MGKPATGEIVRMSAPDLEVINPASREVAVSAFLEDARDSLARALDETGPHAVAQIKAEIAVVAEMTKQLNLSKECRDDATEMVRRAEYALAKALRKGQEDGTVARRGQTVRRYDMKGLRRGESPADHDVDQFESTVSRQTDFASHGELYGSSKRPGIMDLADIPSTEGDFDDAVSKAKSEGDLSRSNIVRKLKGEARPEHKGRGNERRQINAAESATTNLRGMLDGLEVIFNGGFEKTFTPEIAADYARKLRAEHRRLGTLINQINTHGKAHQS